MISVIFPSRSKDAAQHCIESLQKNSKHLSEIIVLWNGGPDKGIKVKSAMQEALEAPERWYDVKGMDVYAMFNLGSRLAQGEVFVLVNDDMYFPPNWDQAIFDHFSNSQDKAKEALTFTLVEPGIVDVSEKNICKDFGRSLETFDKAGFDAFAAEPHITERGLGWYMPVALHRTTIEQFGYYDTTEPFPFPNDIYYFEYLIQQGVQFFKTTQKVYHFQRLSQRSIKVKHEKLHLCCGPEHFDGYLNCDIAGSDLDLDLSSGIIPFEEGQFSDVIMKHGLEHFRHETARQLLREIVRVMKKGGTFHVLVPDLELAMQDVLLGYHQHENCAPAMLRIFGQNTSEPLVHRWGYTVDSLTSELFDAGFSKVSTGKKLHIDEIYLIGEK